MFTRINLRRACLLTAILFLLTACAPVRPAAAPPAAADAAPRVYFVEPQDGATVAAPVQVVMAADNFVVEPASETVTAGHGHLHIMVDTACVAAGQGVPKDDTHLHYGQGQLEAALELAPGPHTLCLQAADGLHVALPGAGMTQTIAITVD
jgi:ABC-type Fe3+-hydroxamate transport system substrate-binding protein